MTDLEALECIVVDLTQLAKKLNKQEIEQVRKSLEVLEIIKKKNVATFLIPCCNNARDYSMKTSGFEALTDKEFKLLKEWLENE